MVKKTNSKHLAALHQSAPQAPTHSNDSETASNVEIPSQKSVKLLLKAFGNQDGGSGQPSQRVRDQHYATTSTFFNREVSNPAARSKAQYC